MQVGGTVDWLWWLVWLGLVVACAGVVVAGASSWRDYRAGLCFLWWRWWWVRPVLWGVDGLAGAVGRIWRCHGIVFPGFWLGLFPRLVEAVGWSVLDFVRDVWRGEVERIYGVWFYCGLPGTGKTVSGVAQLEDYRARWGDRVFIGTNLKGGWLGDPARGIRGQDVQLSSWLTIVMAIKSDKPCIFLIDEVQNTFGSREWGAFPKALMYLTTQSRKWGRGVRLVLTCQDFLDVDPKLRRLAQWVVDCGPILGARLVHQVAYNGEKVYGKGADPLIGPSRRVGWRKALVVPNSLRRQYDTYGLAGILEDAESEEPEDPYVQMLRLLESMHREQKEQTATVGAAAALVSSGRRK